MENFKKFSDNPEYVQFRTRPSEDLPNMPPKKRKNKEVVEENDIICKHYNRGYCYKRDHCEEKHPDKVCNDRDCDEESCRMRHPNPCNYGFRCKFQKKKICLYSHVTLVSDDEKKIGELSKRLIMVEKDNNSLKTANQELTKKMEDKFQSFEVKIELLRKSIEIKEDKLSSLETKVNEQEVLFNEKLEKLTREKKFKCDKCDYETNKESTMHNHKSKKHQKNTEMDDSIFPKQCDLCEIVLNNKKEMKNHRRTHSFNYVTFKCALCDFMGGEQIEMEIHDAKMHSEKFECDLCEFEGKYLPTIEIHLSTNFPD